MGTSWMKAVVSSATHHGRRKYSSKCEIFHGEVKVEGKKEYTPIIILNQKNGKARKDFETSWNIYKANDDSVTATCELLSNNWHEAFRLETNNVHQTRDFFQAIGVQKDPPPHKTPREISQETRITEDNLKVEENHQCIISNKGVSISLSSLNELKCHSARPIVFLKHDRQKPTKSPCCGFVMTQEDGETCVLSQEAHQDPHQCYRRDHRQWNYQTNQKHRQQWWTLVVFHD